MAKSEEEEAKKIHKNQAFNRDDMKNIIIIYSNILKDARLRFESYRYKIHELINHFPKLLQEFNDCIR